MGVLQNFVLISPAAILFAHTSILIHKENVMRIKLGIAGAIVAGAFASTLLLNGQPTSLDNAQAFIEAEIAKLQGQLDYLETQRPSTLAAQKSKAEAEKVELEYILEESDIRPKAREVLEKKIKTLDYDLTELDKEDTEELPTNVGELRSTIAQLEALLETLQ